VEEIGSNMGEREGDEGTKGIKKKGKKQGEGLRYVRNYSPVNFLGFLPARKLSKDRIITIKDY
jgi:hypothetical protein